MSKEGPTRVNVDIETYSDVDIAKCGLYKYAQSTAFAVLLLAYSINWGPVIDLDLTQMVDYQDGLGERPMVPPVELMDVFFDEKTFLYAYNAAFEWYCLSRYFELTEAQSLKWLKHWRCTMLHGMYCGYPAGLGACGKALGLPQDVQKDRQGKALIKTFCIPCEPTQKNGYRTRTLPAHEPEKWELFKDYNKQDVVAEMAIDKALESFIVPAYVQRDWEIDQIINSRGVMADLELVNGALTIASEHSASLLAEAEKITGLKNPNSRNQLISWLTEETGEELTTLRKADVDALLGKDLPSADATRILEIRQELSKTSISKYSAIQKAVCDDGRIRGSLRFYGANRTGRWAGQIVQPQNLPRTHLPAIDLARKYTKECNTVMLRLVYGSVTDTLSQLVRTSLIPAKGKRFIDADFSAIEARVVAWIAGEEWVLDVFRTHGKIYEATASNMFGVPIEKIKKGQPEYELRQKGKVATLALGYGGGTGALTAMGALKMGLTEEELPDIVRRWRESNPNIVRLWGEVQANVLETLKTARPHAIPHLQFSLRGDGERAWLVVTLPSGRELYYARPHIVKDRWERDSFGYYGDKGFVEVEAWGGKMVENIVQAVARDCLAESIRRLEAAGYRIVFHVHDEVVIEADEGQNLEDVCKIMGQAPEWAAGLPLRADGWVGNYFTKD